jgi:hypothetical protein
MARFEDEYMDVLQNIEFGIVRVYQDHPEMTDWDALNAIDALIRMYQAQARKRDVPALPLAPLVQKVFDSGQTMCEWRLGRSSATFKDKQGKPLNIPMRTITLDEMLACLKRIRHSIEFWNKKGGRQGYLKFVSQFVR